MSGNTISPSYYLGLFFIFLVSVIWAAASVLVQFVYSDKNGFDSPFLLTYIGTSLFTVLIPIDWIFHSHKRNAAAIATAAENDATVGIVENSDFNRANYETLDTPAPAPPSPTPSNTGVSTTSISERPKAWTTRDHIIAAAKLAPVWFFSNYTYNASLKYTSITSSTVLASTGSLFTFMFALILRDEHYSGYKMMGILLGMAGSIMTALHDFGPSGDSDGSDRYLEAASADDDNNEVGDQRLWGDVLGLLSAVGYGAYAVMVRVMCPRDESLFSMELFLGLVGFWNMALLSPIALHELARHPGLSALVFGLLVIKGLLDNVLSDYLWARAVILTSATVATVGLALTIPLAFASDLFMGKGDVLNMSSVIGAIAVAIGFFLVNVGQQKVDEGVDIGFEVTLLEKDPSQLCGMMECGMLECSIMECGTLESVERTEHLLT